MNVHGKRAKGVQWARTLVREHPAAGDSGRHSTAEAGPPRRTLPPGVAPAWFHTVMDSLQGRCSDATGFAIADAFLLRLGCANDANPAELELDLSGLRRSELAAMRTVLERSGGAARWSGMSGTRGGVSRITSFRLDAPLQGSVKADDIAVASLERLDWNGAAPAHTDLAEGLAALTFEQAQARGDRSATDLVLALVRDGREGALALVLDGLAESRDWRGMERILDAILRLADDRVEPPGRLWLLLAAGPPSDEPSAQGGPGQPFLSRLCSKFRESADPTVYVVAFAYLSQILRWPHLSHDAKVAVCLSLHWDGNPYEGPLRKDAETHLTAAEVAANEGRPWLAAAILHAIVASSLPQETKIGLVRSRLGVDAGAVLRSAAADFAAVADDSEALNFARDGVRGAWAFYAAIPKDACDEGELQK